MIENACFCLEMFVQSLKTSPSDYQSDSASVCALKPY